MKQFLWFLLCLPFAGLAQQNVLSSLRLFPKVDKVAQFEKALAAHAQKYHSGKTKWRVFQIESGQDFGGYMVSEGPSSWEEIENRGEISAAHTADWNANIAPLLTERAEHSYAVYQEKYSTIALTDYSDWIWISRITVKPGYMDVLYGWAEKMNKAWKEGNSTVAVYTPSSSGPNGLTIVTRYKQGLKERNPGFRPPFRELFEKANGAGSWEKDYLIPIQTAFLSSTNELLRLRKDLSSKQ